LLVLDDVLSAADHATEEKLLAVLRRAMQQRGTSAVVVSHRLSALAHTDQIAVLEAGRVTELGTHAVLLARGGLYARVWELQQQQPDEPAEAVAQPVALVG
jgi:ABC-type multidrug transport system fused ATPase/permease subunit